MSKPRTIFDAILHQRKSPCGDFMEEFEPVETEEFKATDAQPGTPEKIEVLCRRIELGLPLWHADDPVLSHFVGNNSRLHISSPVKFDSRYVLGVLRKSVD
jgi:hypothetical protein